MARIFAAAAATADEVEPDLCRGKLSSFLRPPGPQCPDYREAPRVGIEGEGGGGRRSLTLSLEIVVAGCCSRQTLTATHGLVSRLVYYSYTYVANIEAPAMRCPPFGLYSFELRRR